MDSELVTYFTPLCIMVIVITYCVRYAIRGCCGKNGERGPNDYRSHYYIADSSHQCRRIYLDDSSHMRTVMIATRAQPDDDYYPQIIGYVLDPSLLSVDSQTFDPNPPSYEDALLNMRNAALQAQHGTTSTMCDSSLHDSSSKTTSDYPREQNEETVIIQSSSFQSSS
uniref:Vesicular, overexpressed in cancer, prosurvival protein 1 n=1 Tax=Heterorhabditis bacteriophora TaxID=37862 RepID=A0A1I7X3K4_HETBA